jgi:predicted GIY-YIG superfamily endonuclease
MPTGNVGSIYLLHYSKRTSRGHQHYLGWTEDLARRLRQHQIGRGAEETKIAVAEGAKLLMVQTWIGTRALESQIKTWSRSHRAGFAGLWPKCGRGKTLPPELEAALGPGSMRRIYSPTTG